MQSVGMGRYLTVVHSVRAEPNANPVCWVHSGNTFNNLSDQSKPVLKAAAIVVSSLVRARLQETV
jgi:hypothetical protein